MTPRILLAEVRAHGRFGMTLDKSHPMISALLAHGLIQQVAEAREGEPFGHFIAPDPTPFLRNFQKGADDRTIFQLRAWDYIDEGETTLNRSGREALKVWSVE